MDARYVELTPLDNYYGSGPGGDRVGIGEIAFQVPTPGTVTAADLDYGISGKNNNSFNFDFSTQPVWTAGSQRSDNGSADAGNRRAGRVFVDFQLDADIIAAAAREGATASLTFEVDSIGSGVAGTPYIDGLDLRYLGLNASDRSAATLWNTGGVGGTDQADILVTAGPTGSHTITLTNASILSQIAGATPGQYVAFGMSNSIGITGDPVGNSTAETYGFQMSQATGNYALTVSGPIPEPMTMLAVGLAVAGLGGYIRKRRRA